MLFTIRLPNYPESQLHAFVQVAKLRWKWLSQSIIAAFHSCMMIAIAINLCLVMVGAVLTLVAGQAPGDEQELCTVSLPALGQNIVEDPPNGRILMDSSHYSRLLPPNPNPVWQEVDLDDNNPTGIHSSVSNFSDNNTMYL